MRAVKYVEYGVGGVGFRIVENGTAYGYTRSIHRRERNASSWREVWHGGPSWIIARLQLQRLMRRQSELNALADPLTPNQTEEAGQ